MVVRVEVPAEAFLDPAALDYLTVLRIRVTATRDGIVEYGRSAPPAYLAWPSGSDLPAVVWDQPTADLEAPNGLLSEVIRAELGPLPSNVRVHPPLSVAGERE